jgi:SAM-dependent methyltransferase
VDKAQVLKTYDGEYARAYESRYVLSDHYRKKAGFEAGVLADLIPDGGQWLDVACGTGYLLSRFPGVRRAGIDISPDMLALARQANPDVLFLEERDFTDEVPEWTGRWDVVSCTWYSYGLVESLRAVERLIANLAAWTSERGSCFVPVFDPANLGRGIRVPYLHRNAGFPPGTILITSVTWTWIENSGQRHDDMVAPTVEHMTAILERYFESVQLVPYPKLKRWGRRRMKALIASSKR